MLSATIKLTYVFMSITRCPTLTKLGAFRQIFIKYLQCQIPLHAVEVATVHSYRHTDIHPEVHKRFWQMYDRA